VEPKTCPHVNVTLHAARYWSEPWAFCHDCGTERPYPTPATPKESV